MVGSVAPRILASVAQVRGWISRIRDPEIPGLSISDLGIVQEVSRRADGHIHIAIAPTFSGCPAHAVILAEIRKVLADRGVTEFTLETRLSPPWSSDRITPAGRAALLRAGIAPPVAAPPVATPPRRHGPAQAWRRGAGAQTVPGCPQCGSGRTERLTSFGSTPCKAQARCGACGEVFEFFKCS